MSTSRLNAKPSTLPDGENGGCFGEPPDKQDNSLHRTKVCA